MPYWISRYGQKYGPYSLDQLKQMAADGSVIPEDLVWQEGAPRWVPLSDLSSSPGSEFTPSVLAFRTATPSESSYPAGPYYSSTGPIPPDLHWVFVLLLGLITCGIFSFAWFLVMANFIRKLTGENSPIFFAIAGFMSIQVGTALRIASKWHQWNAGLHQTGVLFVLFGVALYIAARFRARSELMAYYNTVDPIALHLSDLMTFFFGLYYLQYHFSRIARWKKTGYLRPQ